jgi:hypothetical protein
VPTLLKKAIFALVETRAPTLVIPEKTPDHPLGSPRPAPSDPPLRPDPPDGAPFAVSVPAGAPISGSATLTRAALKSFMAKLGVNVRLATFVPSRSTCRRARTGECPTGVTIVTAK